MITALQVSATNQSIKDRSIEYRSEARKKQQQQQQQQKPRVAKGQLR
jgi:hypothetical protein